MKIQELMEGKNREEEFDLDLEDDDKDLDIDFDEEDFEDEDEDEDEEDADTGDSDNTTHILMQLRKALDLDGDYSISFKDGSKEKLTLDEIKDFIQKYLNAKPIEKSLMQSLAIQSYDDFKAALHS